MVSLENKDASYEIVIDDDRFTHLANQVLDERNRLKVPQNLREDNNLVIQRQQVPNIRIDFDMSGSMINP